MAFASSNNNILCCWLFPVVVILVLLGNKVVESQNTSFNIDPFTPHSLLLKYERDAFVPPDVSYVRLIGVNGSGYPNKHSVGRVLFNSPVELWEQGKQASFETTITLQMTSTNVANVTDGHGMTFFIVPVNSTKSTGGDIDNLGIYDAVVAGSPIFAVEFDIAHGGLDPDYKHIGININSQRSQNLTRADGIMGQRVTARITYDVPTKKINVVATYGSRTVNVSFVFNLAALLPKQVQVGLSASTGTYLAYLDAYTWHFNSTMVPDVYGGIRKNETYDTYIKQYVM